MTETIKKSAVEDHRTLAGKVVAVRLAFVKDAAEFGYRWFDPPIRVKIGDQFDPNGDVVDDGWWKGVMGTHYDATPVTPVPMPDGFVVYSIEGPSYYADGSTETPDSWVQKIHDLL